MITETQLQEWKEVFSPSKKTETTFKDCRIVVEEFEGTYDYEILYQDSFMGKWHVWHSDTDFETEEQARKEAESWIDNYDGPGDEYYAQ
jgi:hypothetical protein